MSDKQRPRYGSEEYKAAQAEIAVFTKAAYDALAEAQAVADRTGVGFSFDVSYGMGGSYSPDFKGGDDWESSTAGTWVSSTQSCN